MRRSNEQAPTVTNHRVRPGRTTDAPVFAQCPPRWPPCSSVPGMTARAQYAYPAGYGGLGLGRMGISRWPEARRRRGTSPAAWGPSPPGRACTTRQTAVARSINADTAMRWNNYIYASSVEAERRREARLLADRKDRVEASRRDSQAGPREPHRGGYQQRQFPERGPVRDQRPEDLPARIHHSRHRDPRQVDPRHPLPARRIGPDGQRRAASPASTPRPS